MKIITVKPHSFVDVITNSSTELYVCNSGKTLKTIKEILVNVLDAYNHAKDENLKFKNVFAEPCMFDKKKHKWITDSNWYNANLSEGDILIFGASDNSIPWAIDSYLEEIFGSRIHLG